MINKKVLSFILLVALFLTMAPSLNYEIAFAALVGPKEVVLADFSQGSIPDDVTVVDRNKTTNTAAEIDEEVSYEGISSLAYTFDATSTHIIMPYDSDLYSEYDVFKVRVYAKIPGQKINFLVNEQATASSGSDKGCHLEVMETNGEWQVFSIPVSTLSKKWDSTPENLYVLLNCNAWNISPGTSQQLGQTYLNNKGQTYTYSSIKGESFHIDKIWLENSTYRPQNQSTIKDDGIIFDVNSEYDRDDALVSESDRISEEITDENAFNGEYSYKLSYPTAGGTEFVSLKKGDISAWSYVNYLIYLPKSSEEYMRLIIDSEDTSESGDSYFALRQKLDWEGWRLLSVPVSDYSVSRNADLKKITGHKINFGGWDDAMTEAGYIQIDRIWLTSDKPSSLVADAEYEDSSEYVPVNLGGDNAFSFVFDCELMTRDYSDCVSVFEKSASEEYHYAEVEYSVVAEGNELKIAFSDNLTIGNTYKIVIDKMSLLSSEYAQNSEEISTSFTVEAASSYFEVVGLSVADKSENVLPDSYEIEFNHEPDDKEIPEYISVYANGEKQYNLCSYQTDGKKLIIKFNAPLSYDTKYEISVSADYKDIYGNKINGASKFSFTTPASEKEQVVATFFSASNDSDISRVTESSQFKEETTNVNIYEKAVRIDYAAGKDKSNYVYKGNDIDVSAMNYINFWMYSPEISEDVLVFVVYTNRDDNKGTAHKLTLDWKGWNLVSIEKSNLGGYDIIDAINFNFGGWSTVVEESGYVVFDEVWASKERPEPIELVSSSFPDGYSDAEIQGQTLALEFSDTINTSVIPQIILTNQYGVNISDFSVTYVDNMMNISFGKLEPLVAYTLEVSNISGTQPVIQNEPIAIEFSAKSEGVYVDSVIFNSDSLDEGSELEVSYSVQNYTDSEYDFYAVLVVNDEDNRLLASDTVPFKSVKEICDVKAELTCPNGAHKAIAYILTSDDRILSNRYFSLDSNGVSDIYATRIGGNKSSLKIERAELKSNILEIKGVAIGVNDIIRITLKGNSIIAQTVVKANNEGMFSFYFVFPSDFESGEYKVEVKSDNASDFSNVRYISKPQRDSMLTLANSSSESDLCDFIEDNKTQLGMKDISKEEISEISQIVIRQNEFDSFEILFDFIKTITDLVDEINSAKWNAVGDIVLQNTDILDADDSVIKAFTALSAKNRGKVCEILAKSMPADGIGDFKSKLADAIEEYENSSGSSSGGSNSGAGGSGGKSTSSVSFPESFASVPKYTPIESNTIFNDLDSCEWARESIMNLYASGIVSAAADGRFRPNDSITREEFVKMIVCAFADDVAYVPHMFNDEAEGAWYNEYLSKAYSLGITLGYPDGSFGVGENITREDMVTLCARAIEALGETLPQTTGVEFTDSKSISSYAYPYVSAMTGLGVVNGMGDGSFAPGNATTRAEAAKVIACLIKLY